MKRTKSKPRRRPNYLRQLLSLYRLGALPVTAVHLVDIAHEGWCQHVQGKPCNCDPDVRLKCSVSGSTN